MEAREKRATFSEVRWARSVRPRRRQLPQGPSVCDKIAASSDCSRPVNDYVHIEAADLCRPNARFTQERQGYQVLTLFGKLGYSLIQDLKRTSGIVGLVRNHVSEHGRIYGLCHCAGAVETRPLTSFKVSNFREMMDVNVAAGLELSRAICRRDVATDEGGSLLFIASVYGSVGMPGQTTYSASKGAVLAAARSLAVELARRGIRVNTLSPGLIRTAMTEGAFSRLSGDQVRALEAQYPLGVGQPEDVARAAAFLLAPQSSWITGTDLVIDGGYTAR